MGRDANDSSDQLDPETARLVDATMQPLATPSCVLIPGRLRSAPMSVGDIARAVCKKASTVTHQPRVVRQLGLVTVVRQGRMAVYALHDDHAAELVDQAVHHVAHRRLGLARSWSAGAS